MEISNDAKNMVNRKKVNDEPIMPLTSDTNKVANLDKSIDYNEDQIFTNLEELNTNEVEV